MGEPGFDEHTQPFRGAPAPPSGYGQDFAGPHRAQGEPWQGAGPLGDWLHEAGAAWAAGPPPGPPGYAGGQFARPPAPPAPWVTPPHLEEEPRSRWSLTGAAPWVVAGLLVAVLLTGRDAPAAAPAGAPVVEVAGTDPVPADPAVPAPVAASCAGVTP